MSDVDFVTTVNGVSVLIKNQTPIDEKSGLSFEILLLNDLLRTNAIDKEIYDEAIKRLTATDRKKEKQEGDSK